MKKLLLIAIVSALAAAAHASDSTSLSLNVGDWKYSQPFKVVDKVTGSTLSATISDVVVESNTSAAATFTITQSIGGYPLVQVRATAAGTGYATVTCTATYTDPGDGLQKTEQKSIVIAYTVVGTPHGAKLSLAFN